jgi:hypothetical protein
MAPLSIFRTLAKLTTLLSVVLFIAFLSRLAFAQGHSAVFLPGIVSTEANEFNSCFSKDNNSFYFSRTIDTKSQIFVTTMENGNWSMPERLPFCNEQFAYADPAISPDGVFYFVSNMPTAATDTTHDYNIWRASFNNGQWKEPVNVIELNSSQDEYYISFTEAGDVYFSSSRSGGYGEEDLYYSKFGNGSYGPPVNLGSHVNSLHSEYDPFISKNGKVLIFASSGRPDSFGKADLYWIKKSETWEKPNHFGSTVNTPSRDYCPYIGEDGAFYFSSDGQVKKIDALNLNAQR